MSRGCTGFFRALVGAGTLAEMVFFTPEVALNRPASSKVVSQHCRHVVNIGGINHRRPALVALLVGFDSTEINPAKNAGLIKRRKSTFVPLALHRHLDVWVSCLA